MDQLQDTIIKEPLRWLDIKVINPSDFTELLVRLGLNLLVTFVVVHYIYSKNSNRKDFYFSYFSISMTVFVLCFLLESVKLELGFALGLFAIFGIIRYRTDAIPIKEMTYLFVIIGISVINSLSNKKVSHIELMFTNVAIVSTMWILEKALLLKQEICLVINYENINNINIKKKAELYADIQERTGIKVKRIEIEEINYLRDVAKIKVFHDINDSNGDTNTF
ncbi:DUF4956 domain-containing protein [Draconibacterium sp. IB214405]|uniref:DUF4956 domain-containing protein n=1 Tax=Draconibacterium sp. IB214405 TaxID=3097352 RepID=UPI002A11E7BC|nr:DUF4956 domain-containing protein [Draconibacterium sp. IB214405]MDX8339794.1 DUF4956 domain-containing protein [Draconibacterium sp. IB214405]